MSARAKSRDTDERSREERVTATPMSMLGGYDPQAGRNAHEADKPTLIPVPSLLRSLLSDHLDPGYAAAAEAKAGGGEAPDVVAGVDVADLRRARRSPRCSPQRSLRPARRHPVCTRRNRCWREASSPREATDQ